jgi:nucleoside-diphosphate-sugar epimerase
MADLSKSGSVVFREAPASGKDYISIDDTVEMLYKMAIGGAHRLYNVASGKPISHRTLADALSQRGYTAEFAAHTSCRRYPVIGTMRMTKEFGMISRSLCNDLTFLLEQSRQLHSARKIYAN